MKTTNNPNQKVVKNLCEACQSRGWLMTPAGAIERCDECEAFDCDWAAQEYVKRAVDGYERMNRIQQFAPDATQRRVA